MFPGMSYLACVGLLLVFDLGTTKVPCSFRKILEFFCNLLTFPSLVSSKESVFSILSPMSCSPSCWSFKKAASYFFITSQDIIPPEYTHVAKFYFEHKNDAE